MRRVGLERDLADVAGDAAQSLDPARPHSISANSRTRLWRIMADLTAAS
jgi:hypothetical protein